MKIKKFSFPDGIWEHDGIWRATLDVNDIRDAYMVYIEEKKLSYEIFHEESQYSKEETEELIKEALKDEEILKNIEEIRYMITVVKTISDKEKIEPVLLSYTIDEHWEMFRFTIGIEEMELEYSVALENENEIYSTLFYNASKKHLIDQIDSYFSKEMNHRIVKEIRDQPIARLRRMYNKRKGE